MRGHDVRTEKGVGSGILVAAVGGGNSVFENAHLIAASPDGFALIDTLNAILTQFPDGRHVNWHSIKADCEAYLRKVKGE